ncbi:hypothetical protein PN499_02765 [Kamptonema animale CS-326]|nr:hypothetical protein [Kamptonema animale CS-326]
MPGRRRYCNSRANPPNASSEAPAATPIAKLPITQITTYQNFTVVNYYLKVKRRKDNYPLGLNFQVAIGFLIPNLLSSVLLTYSRLIGVAFLRSLPLLFFYRLLYRYPAQPERDRFFPLSHFAFPPLGRR